MKLRFYSFLFTATTALVSCLTWALRQAHKAREAAWVACTSENLRTLNVRQAARSRFN
jgi:hypothetical protein